MKQIGSIETRTVSKIFVRNIRDSARNRTIRCELKPTYLVVDQKQLKKQNGESGFTLIELLVAACIIAVLAAIATTQFFIYKRNAFDAQAHEDLRNSMSAQEIYFVDAQQYNDCVSPLDCENKLPSFVATRNADSTPSMDIFTHTSQAGGQAFNAESKHHNSPSEFRFDSTLGRIEKN